MNILISAGTLDKTTNASSKIAVETAIQLSKLGNNCIICGISYETDTVESDGVIYKYFSYDCDRNDKKTLYSLYMKNIEELVIKHNIQALITVMMPFGPTQAIMLNDNVKCAKYIYQLDPWGLHEFREFYIKTEDERIAQEIGNFERAEHIFTTPLLLDDYFLHSDYEKYCHKMTALEFPTITERKYDISKSVSYDRKYINILYTGFLSDDYRSVEPFLNFIAASNFKVNNKSIKFTFMGNIKSESLLKIEKACPEQIQILERMELPFAIASMKQADFLLCSGNRFTNQIPSKLLDYVSTGKPIVFIKKIADCPSIEYLKRYPLKYIFDETSFYNKYSDFESFIESNLNNEMPFEYIEKIYYKATPKYVVKKINEVLKQK